MFKKSLAVGLAGVVAFVFSGCGTLFWSERKTETPVDGESIRPC